MPHYWAREWQIFVLSLSEPVQPFLAYDPDGRQLQTPGDAGAPKVNGAGQTGTSLITDGWTANFQLKRGDYISFSNGTFTELHMIVADVQADGLGNATLSVRPSIRRSPADNADITVEDASVEMLMTNPENSTWDVGNIATYGMMIEGEEWIR